MNDIRLSIIVATTGRPTLARALASATSQMSPGDELIVVFDDSGDAGDTPRNRVMPSATGTHITFLDDDDAYRPGALDAIRAFARSHPRRVGIFRIDLGVWGTAWQQRNLMHTGTGMYVIPNEPGKIGRFGRAPGIPAGRVGDYRFIIETVALQGEPIWCETITQDIKPEPSAYRRLRYRLRLGTRVRRAIGIAAPDPKAASPVYAEAERWGAEQLRRAARDPVLAGAAREADSC